MNIPVVIDVMIGLVLVYFLLSTIASTLVEMLSLRLRWRNAVLRRTVERLLVGEDQAVRVTLAGKNKNILVAQNPDEAGQLVQSGLRLQTFWEHPVISRLRAPGTDAPAYMTGERFASAVVDIATGQGRLGVVPNSIPALHHAIEAESEGEMERALLALLRGVSPEDPDPRARLLQAVARWYDEAMERSSVTYRRKVQMWLFGLGLAVAVVLNVDTVRMISVLSTDAGLRARMVEYAVKLEDRQAAAVAPAAPVHTVAPAQGKTAATEPTAPAGTAVASAPVQPVDAPAGTPAPAAVSREQLRDQVRGLRDLAGEGFPLGWVEPFTDNFAPIHPTGFWSWVMAVFTKGAGCLVTAFAICLGAPFWFDLLNKLLKLRAARNADAEKAGATAVDATGGNAPLPARPSEPAPAFAAASQASQGQALPPSLRLPFDEELRQPGTAFSAARASWLAEAADLSYQPEAELRRLGRDSWGSVELLPICNDKTDTQCFLILGTGVAVLAFRGTEPTRMKDITTDLSAMPVQQAPYPGRVHKGFATALESIWPLLAERIRALQGSGRLLHVTGHSLGGALATLAALRLQKERLYPVQTVYTYGSPRAGDSDFALAFDALLGTRCHRVVNNEDLVTRVPMRSMGYKHIGQIAYIDERGVLRFDVGYWYRFLNLVANASASLEVAAKTSFRDHSMTLYRQHLDKGLV